VKLDRDILKILACPVCKGDLEERGENLLCKKCGRRYPIIDGIPYLLPDELMRILELK